MTLREDEKGQSNAERQTMCAIRYHSLIEQDFTGELRKL